MRWTCLSLSAHVLIAACATAPESSEPTTTDSIATDAPEPACAIPERHRLFIREVLLEWAEVEAHILALDDADPPAMFFASKECVFTAHHPGGAPVGEVHPGDYPAVALSAHPWANLALPDGMALAPGIHSFAGVGDDGRPYFVLSLMDFWSEHPRAGSMPDAADFIIGIGLHELAHTRQLPTAKRALEAALADVEVDNINDDVVQSVMAGHAEYAALVRESIDAFWAAVGTEGGARVKKVREGLAAVKARRALLTGEQAWLADVEPIFLNLEGVGEWVRTRVLLTAGERPPDPAFVEAEAQFTGWKKVRAMRDADVIKSVRDQTKRRWTQEEGLALMLLLDGMMPSWRDRVFADPPGDLHALLAEVVQGLP